MTAEPSASIWEVTRLILDSPGASPSEIAQAHGFSAAEVADLLPIVLDNARADWSQHGDGGESVGLPLPAGAGEEHADRYLRELVESRSVDVAGYDPSGAVADGTDVDPGALDDLATAGNGAAFPDGGLGIGDGTSGRAAVDQVDLRGVADAGADPAADGADDAAGPGGGTAGPDSGADATGADVADTDGRGTDEGTDVAGVDVEGGLTASPDSPDPWAADPESSFDLGEDDPFVDGEPLPDLPLA